jgi:hypothetical protein
MKAWKELMRVVDRLRFEPHDIAAQLDGRRHYAMELSEEFPLSIKLFRYTSRRHTRGATWHERLELFLPIDGKVRFRMGEQEVELQRGDLLVVDNLKLHHVVDFPGFNTRVVVISFLPEFVYSLGSLPHELQIRWITRTQKIRRRRKVVCHRRQSQHSLPGEQTYRL